MTPRRWLTCLAAAAAVVVLGVVVALVRDDGGAGSIDAAPAADARSAVRLDQLRPAPQAAKDDRPDFYTDGSGCQVKDGDPVPAICASGDESAERTVMLLGDSKIAQWETAYADLGRANGWRVLTVTKSACPFTDAAVSDSDQPDVDCRAWGRAALKEVLREKPDVVVTSQRASTAMLDDGSDRTRGAMIRGLHSYWTQLQAAGIKVVVHLDNPFPTTHPVYACVQDHPTDFAACDFDLKQGWAESSAPVLKEAAETLPGVSILDMTPTICPGGRTCPAVIDDVLLYRAGSHLTRTFTVSVEPQLAVGLERATGGLVGATSR